jgi:hypothetical protein
MEVVVLCFIPRFNIHHIMLGCWIIHVYVVVIIVGSVVCIVVFIDVHIVNTGEFIGAVSGFILNSFTLSTIHSDTNRHVYSRIGYFVCYLIGTLIMSVTAVAYYNIQEEDRINKHTHTTMISSHIFVDDHKHEKLSSSNDEYHNFHNKLDHDNDNGLFSSSTVHEHRQPFLQ